MSEFLDKTELTEDIFSQLNESIQFIKKHINYEGKIEGLQRIDRYEIPMVAIRESVINALVHRDYQNAGRDIKIGIYDDIVNIVSPGGFPLSITEQDLFNGRSEIRNKVIARVFKELDYIEQWGSGIKRIIDSCNEYELKIPEIKEIGESVDVCIYRRKTNKNKRVVKNEGYYLTNQEKQIVEYLEKMKSIKRKEVENILEIKKTQAFSIINTLIKKNLIEKVGQGKITYYILK